LGNSLVQSIARLNVEVEYASEDPYQNPIVSSKDVILAISQSGATADTLVALENATQQGATIFGIVNVVGSSIARISDAGAYTHAGPEIGVASTKAFTAQLAVLQLLALKLAEIRGTISQELFTTLLHELD